MSREGLRDTDVPSNIIKALHNIVTEKFLKPNQIYYRVKISKYVRRWSEATEVSHHTHFSLIQVKAP
jgi:hypothetical protein